MSCDVGEVKERLENEQRAAHGKNHYGGRAYLVFIGSLHLVSVIFQSAFAHDTQAPPQASWCGAIITARSHLVFLQDKVNSVRYIAQFVNPVLLSFLRQDVDVAFSAGQRTSTYGCCDAMCSPCGIQLLPWPARTPDLSSIETYCT